MLSVNQEWQSYLLLPGEMKIVSLCSVLTQHRYAIYYPPLEARELLLCLTLYQHKVKFKGWQLHVMLPGSGCSLCSLMFTAGEPTVMCSLSMFAAVLNLSCPADAFELGSRDDVGL